MHFLEMAMTCLTTEMIMNYLCGDEWMFSAILHTLVHSSFSMGRMSYGSLFYLFKGCTYQKYDLCGASDRSKKAGICDLRRSLRGLIVYDGFDRTSLLEIPSQLPEAPLPSYI
jgi:hypothetical protein